MYNHIDPKGETPFSSVVRVRSKVGSDMSRVMMVVVMMGTEGVSAHSWHVGVQVSGAHSAWVCGPVG